jgi:streptomycin 6-kinase
VTSPAAVLGQLLQEWELALDETDPLRCAPPHVAAVRTAEGRRAVLKVVTGEPNAHLAYRHWAGNGAVELLRADPHRGALLLERAGAEDLTSRRDSEAAEIVAALYGRLHVPAPPQLRTLPEMLAAWIDRVHRDDVSTALPRRLVEQATALAGQLAADPASTGSLLHTDLHYGNVLAADRQPWLAISPRPLNGDPHFELAPMLWHRWDELSGRVRAGVRARFAALVDAAGFDEDRARAWVVVRAVRRATRTADRNCITTCVTLAKAVQD